MYILRYGHYVCEHHVTWVMWLNKKMRYMQTSGEFRKYWAFTNTTRMSINMVQLSSKWG